MEEQLISYETAKLAKEKGFDEICYISKWWDTKINHEQIYPHYRSNMAAPRNSIINNSKKHLVSAPTQSLLHKWLREVHNIHIEICVEEDAPYRSFYYRTINLGQYFTLSYDDFKSESYETVLEKALKIALNSIN